MLAAMVLALDLVSESAEILLACATDRTGPVIGQVFKFRSLGDLALAIASVGVIHIAAVGNRATPHIMRFCHGKLLYLTIPWGEMWKQDSRHSEEACCPGMSLKLQRMAAFGLRVGISLSGR